MTMLDRHILGRFLLNFVILFAIMFLFAAAIDVVLDLQLKRKIARILGAFELAILRQRHRASRGQQGRNQGYRFHLIL